MNISTTYDARFFTAFKMTKDCKKAFVDEENCRARFFEKPLYTGRKAYREFLSTRPRISETTADDGDKVTRH